MKKIRKHKIVIMIMIISLNIIIFFKPNGYGENRMPLYNLNKALMPKLEPKIYSTKKKKVTGLFSVPVDNAIATNQIGNAITLLHFNDKKIKYKIVKSNFLDYVSSGHDGYMPIISEDTIGYSIGRGFLLFNLKNKKFNYYSIAGHFDYVLSDFYAIDPEKKIFIFKIRDLKKKQPTFLRLMDLSTDSAKIIVEKEVGDCGIAVRDQIIFVNQENTIIALDLKLEEIEHPLVTIFNKEKDKDFGSSLGLIIHPFFPFAIFKENKYDKDYNTTSTIWIISWRENGLNSDKPLMVKLFDKKTSLFQFTNDGKWLIFRDLSQSQKSHILMPIDSELPYFIGKPIYLGALPNPENAKGSAMTQNPSGFVISECEGYKGNCWLKKWDFTEAEKLIKQDK